MATFAAAWGAALAAWRSERAAGLLREVVASGASPRGSRSAGWRMERAGARISAAAEERFLDMLAATANVTLAARAAGASAQGFYKRRLRDPRFAEAWEAAIECGRARLETMLVEAACRSFDPDDLALAAERPAMSIDEAMRILAMRDGRRPGGRPSWAEQRRREEEVKARLLWKLDNLARHAKEEAAERTES